MDWIVVLLILLIIALLIAFYRTFRGDEHFPPSPMRPLPIVGHLLFLEKDFRTQYMKWRDQCGDIFSLYLGSKLLVIINGYDLIKETLVRRADDFSDRPVMVFDELMGYHGQGIAFASGEIWKEQRGLALNIFRKFGLGQNILVERVTEEVTHYLAHINSLNGLPVNIRQMTAASTANVICAILGGKTFSYDDPVFRTLVADMQDIVSTNQQNSMMGYFPLLKYIPLDLPRYKILRQKMEKISSQFQSFIEENKCKDPEVNFISAYMAKRDIHIGRNEATSLDEINLLKVVSDLFIAGSETTSTTICWFVLYMVNYPEVQDRIYLEINEAIGTYRWPTMQDRPKLTYLMASIMETQRLSSISPVAIVRTCTKDATIRGYRIPKGTLISPNLDSVLLEEQTWGPDAKEFRPDRFIDQDGRLVTPDEFIPYGLGRRICLGKSMANMELFIYLSRMMQTFRFLALDPTSPPSLKYTLGMLATPEPYHVKAVRRVSE